MLGRGTGCGSGADLEGILLALLASFISFFHDTYVVSPGRSSTTNTCRSPDFRKDEVGFDDDDSPPPMELPGLSSSIDKSRPGLEDRDSRVFELGNSTIIWETYNGFNWREREIARDSETFFWRVFVVIFIFFFLQRFDFLLFEIFLAFSFPRKFPRGEGDGPHYWVQLQARGESLVVVHWTFEPSNQMGITN